MMTFKAARASITSVPWTTYLIDYLLITLAAIGEAVSVLVFFSSLNIAPSGVTLNPAGRVATAEEVSSAPKDPFGNPIGFRTVFLQGDSRSYDIIRTSEQNMKFLSDLRSSLGLELRVQMPVINVPFRLIFAPGAELRLDPDSLARASAAVVAVSGALAGEEHALDAARTFTAWANGFVSMELSGAFRLGGDVDRAFDYGVDRLADAVAAADR